MLIKKSSGCLLENLRMCTCKLLIKLTKNMLSSVDEILYLVLLIWTCKWTFSVVEMLANTPSNLRTYICVIVDKRNVSRACLLLEKCYAKAWCEDGVINLWIVRLMKESISVVLCVTKYVHWVEIKNDLDQEQKNEIFLHWLLLVWIVKSGLGLFKLLARRKYHGCWMGKNWPMCYSTRQMG